MMKKSKNRLFELQFNACEMGGGGVNDILLHKAKSRKYRGIFEEHSPVK